MNQFAIGDHVENLPVATVDGIVYAVEGDKIRFCDGNGIKYSMNAASLTMRYRRFDFFEEREIVAANSHLFKNVKGGAE